jgi:hypothetical protein
MVYVSYYEEYPIYEPAEGGYYYAGLALVSTERMSKRAAKRLFDEEARQMLEETKDDPYPWIEGNRMFGRQIFRDSKYIGDGAYFCIEKHKGMHSRGWQPYS